MRTFARASCSQPIGNESLYLPPPHEASLGREPVSLVEGFFVGRTSRTLHVRDLGLHSAQDEDVWRYAAEHGLTIVSKDSDFRQRSFLFGHPPKVVWIRLGNCSTADVEALLRAHHENLITFDQDAQGSFLALG
ncbi:MAG: DUF5615 family PIN-like protein [Dehalococcoidia bacterium]|nr:DUF5615 family PIN-like protein [Dehalococcoidia bacterium]